MASSHPTPSLPARPDGTLASAALAPAGVDDCSAHLFPDVTIDSANPSEPLLTRRGVLHTKRGFSARREDAFNDLRGLKPSPEKHALYQEIRFYVEEEAELERRLQEFFIPQHGPTQFLSPRAFFQCALFNARSRSVERQLNVELELPVVLGTPSIRYSGPELRQSDGRVFLALMHMLRDVQAGTRVTLQPEPVCIALFGRYDGNSRKQLRIHIQRLQKGLILTGKFSVQLCLAFDYPSRGPWRVALHPHIVDLFRLSPRVWLSMPLRLTLSEGLSTWLYAFIESQTRLIPMNITTLRELSGSDSGERAFVNSMRLALQELTRRDIIEPGWSLRQGQVRWMKKRPSSTSD
ncbi:MAG: hypothetical protein Q7T10_16300 [Rhodoferax sp.]|uniref:hypothetical protein n=1 Tax=Rhodoferax sp. TaxID=50421 RepID=UPI0027292AE2|nr:hypothetical protein [Rhodoferax sp.]MDO8450361.1 hypothetical protein [Rhodoferax sp.]